MASAHDSPALAKQNAQLGKLMSRCLSGTCLAKRVRTSRCVIRGKAPLCRPPFSEGVSVLQASAGSLAGGLHSWDQMCGSRSATLC